MIVGVGVDMVDVDRFARAIERTPRLVERLFAEGERRLPARSLAARFAAKEAVIKALGGSDALTWHDLEVVNGPSGAPSFAMPAALVAASAVRGADRLHLSLSHDGGFACAFVIAESAGVQPTAAENSR